MKSPLANPHRTSSRLFAVALLGLCVSCAPGNWRLRRDRTFHASFDHGPDADFAVGDRRIHTAPDLGSAEAVPGFRRERASLVEGAGVRGAALRFSGNSKQVLFFPAQGNFAYRPEGWSGSISLWLRLDPDKDLEPGWSDPIQITDKKWDDASIFLDFTKDDRPRHFRLGVFCDTSVWNPDKRPLDDIPANERPFVVVEKTPFSRQRWTHAVITFRDFNRDGSTGTARLYLDGVEQGEISGKPQRFTWDVSRARILLGLSYIGDIDELMLFHRELTAEEIEHLAGAPDLR